MSGDQIGQVDVYRAQERGGRQCGLAIWPLSERFGAASVVNGNMTPECLNPNSVYGETLTAAALFSDIRVVEMKRRR